MQKAVPVLVLGAGSPVGLGLTRSLVESRWPLRVHTADLDPWIESLVEGYRHHRLPRVDDPDYENALAALCRREGIRGVYVCSHAELHYLSHHRDVAEAATGARIFVSRPEIIERMSDKWTAHLWLKANGFPTLPTITVPAAKADIASFIDAVGFPAILKPRFGTASRGLRRIDTVEQLQETLMSYTEPGVLQQHVEGREFTAGVTCARDGTIVTSVVLQRRLRHGVTWRARIAPFDAERAFSETVASALGVEGPCNLQFRYFHGDAVIFDFNVRWSSSTRMRTIAGINEGARLAVYELTGISLPPVQYSRADLVRTWRDHVLPEGERPDP